MLKVHDFCVHNMDQFRDQEMVPPPSLLCAAHWVNDYDYNTLDVKEKKTYRKGETRDTFSSLKYSQFTKEDKELFKDNLNKNSRMQIKFDTNKEKTGWLDQEIKNNGGEKNIMLAIQVALQTNQKAFLRSWEPQ